MFFPRQIKKRAVVYYRHSAEDKQENSVAIQRTHAQKFAEAHDIEIIHEEADEGKSGLSANRPGFDRLFREFILNLDAPAFDYVLVYDVSRWGRFQDQDEAAFWEYRCKLRGKQVVFVSKGFPNEENLLLSHLQISIERYMAAEYSRALGEKVFHGSVEVSKHGFSAGGTAPYGMVRILLDETKKPVQILKHGEQKIISNQRVIFAPVNDKTTDIVKLIFTYFVNKKLSPKKIAESLNSKKVYAPNGGRWSGEKITRILSNETYIGSRIYNKTWHRLKQKQRINPKTEWIVCKNAFEPIVSPILFQKAQERLYWLSSRKWRQGAYAMSNLQRRLRKDLQVFLENKLHIDEDKLWYVIRYFPMAVAVTFYRNESIQCWCFAVDERMKQYDNILGVAVDIGRPAYHDRFFLIPTQNFGIGNFFVLSETDSRYKEYILEENSFEDRMLAFCSSFGYQTS